MPEMRERLLATGDAHLEERNGGEEPEQLAFGAINLRQLWEGRRDLASQVVQLVTDDGEVTTLTVSTAVMPTLERVMQPRR